MAVVAFNEKVTTVLPSQPVGELARERIKQKLDQLTACGSTNLSDGWIEGCNQVAAHCSEHGLNRVLLISDGQANKGVTKLKELEQQASEFHQQAVSTSTFGVGERYNEFLLSRLALAGGGRFTDIGNPRDIPAAVREELDKLLNAVAWQVNLLIRVPLECECTILGDLRHQRDGAELRIALDDLRSGEQRRLYTIVRSRGRTLLPDVTLHGAVAFRSPGEQSGTAHAAITLQYGSRDEVQHARRDLAVIRRARHVQIVGAATRAIQRERAGSVGQAQQILIDALELCNPYLPPEELERYEQLVERLAQRLTEDYRKRTFYAESQKRRAMDEPRDNQAIRGIEGWRENQAILADLFRRGELLIQHAPILDRAPGPMPGHVPWDRIAGMLLGVAIGDALRNTTEGVLPSMRRARHGEIRDYLPNRHTGKRRGLPSDDTQLSFWTVEQLLEDGRLVPEHVAARFSAHRIMGIGAAVRDWKRAYMAKTEPWYRCGTSSAGNGALMRIAPVLLPHLRSGSPALWADATLAALITHRDAASVSRAWPLFICSGRRYNCLYRQNRIGGSAHTSRLHAMLRAAQSTARGAGTSCTTRGRSGVT